MTEMVSDAGNKRPLIHGIDMLRIWAALWVVFAHGAFLNVKALLGTHAPAIGMAFGSLFNGSAAVTIFFIISGFCIHYPNANKPILNWKTFLARRAVRIGIPLVAIIAVTRLLGTSYVQSEDAVLWSLYCELIYYALYPILFAAKKYIKFSYIIYSSVLLSCALLLTHANYLRIWDFKPLLTWLFCAPAWLLGAQLADSFRQNSVRKLPGSIWVWRIAMIGLGSLGTLLLFHTPERFHFTVGIPWTIIPMVGLAYYWIHDELIVFKFNFMTKWFEKIGQASYSLYLIHKIGITALLPILEHTNAILFWGMQIILISVTTSLFYFAVERPSHLIAKRINFEKMTFILKFIGEGKKKSSRNV